VDQAIEDGVGQRGVADEVVPFVDGELVGGQCRSSFSPLLETSAVCADDSLPLSSRSYTRNWCMGWLKKAAYPAEIGLFLTETAEEVRHHEQR